MPVRKNVVPRPTCVLVAYVSEVYHCPLRASKGGFHYQIVPFRVLITYLSPSNLPSILLKFVLFCQGLGHFFGGRAVRSGNSENAKALNFLADIGSSGCKYYSAH